MDTREMLRCKLVEATGYEWPKLVNEIMAALPAQEWQDISTAPKDKMFIWAAPKGEGKWSLGLAYRNVSGGWSDAYGSDAPARATRWHPLPAPPVAVIAEERTK